MTLQRTPKLRAPLKGHSKPEYFDPLTGARYAEVIDGRLIVYPYFRRLHADLDESEQIIEAAKLLGASEADGKRAAEWWRNDQAERAARAAAGIEAPREAAHPSDPWYKRVFAGKAKR